ncbi:hypothetical protein Pla108_30490 [Botrimarina colliarenosi]|uniref:Prenyltransferase and squalene oxidase repeat protein n=1 Tax=Botrimarina colliarenosi TaxID=2528001 RepID=A0A5C6AAB3_9BACT|nr:hypothetical protein [Botrimarina colliarenosi]TWT95971.1 hypothetical protein Pla108_30490 [Botrimarina colliarenosi]
MRTAVADPPLTEAIARAINRLAAAPIGAYHAGGEAASEPTAWGALALARAGCSDSAAAAADWLAERQGGDGSVGVTASQAGPGWPTALAMLAWRGVDPTRYATCYASGVAWALAQRARTTRHNPRLGHDSSLVGWSWAPATHTWLEPTAFFFAALRESGPESQARRDDAERILIDRLLPSGGANYGNTVVLGQELLPHTQSSGVAAWALAGERVTDERLAKTLTYLQGAVQKPTGLASLAWAARGLAGHRAAGEEVALRVASALSKAEAAAESHHKLALLTLAAQEIAYQPIEPIVSHR